MSLYVIILTTLFICWLKILKLFGAVTSTIIAQNAVKTTYYNGHYSFVRLKSPPKIWQQNWNEISFYNSNNYYYYYHGNNQSLSDHHTEFCYLLFLFNSIITSIILRGADTRSQMFHINEMIMNLVAKKLWITNNWCCYKIPKQV